MIGKAIADSGTTTADQLRRLPADSFAVLYPVIDILNHRPAFNIQWIPGKTHLSLAAGAPLEPGQAVWNNYGPKSNEERKTSSSVHSPLIHFSKLNN